MDNLGDSVNKDYELNLVAGVDPDDDVAFQTMHRMVLQAYKDRHSYPEVFLDLTDTLIEFAERAALRIGLKDARN